MKASLRASFATLVGSTALLLSTSAFAAGEPCLNDTDCPGAECGGEVCNWNVPHAAGTDPNKPYTCNAAGTDPKGKDGWCSDGDAKYCKCQALGAICSPTVYCTFTKPSDAPPRGGAGGTGGGAATGGSGGAATGGTGTATGGTGTTTAGTGTTTAGTGTAAPAAADEGGCSVGAAGRNASGAAIGLGLLGLGLGLLRRKR